MTLRHLGAVHQVLASAASGDAVTSSALAIQDALRAERVHSEVFAASIDPALGGRVHHLWEHEHLAPGGVRATIVHVSMGDDQLATWLRNAPTGRLVLSYHNLTPSRFFEGWDPMMAFQLDEGRRLLPALRHRTALAMADSAYSAGELVAAGYEAVEVAGLVLSAERLRDVEPDAETLRRAAAIDAPVVLAVGQLYPHKRADLLLDAVRAMPGAHLVLAGASRLPRYRHELEHLIDHHRLGGRVTVTGPVPVEVLVAWYRSAQVFVTASDHEGFCVPLVEAMWFDLPIVARACAAVPGTAGDAAVLVPAGAPTSALAAALREVLADPGATDALRAAGRERREGFSHAATLVRLVQVLGGAAL